MGLLLQQHTAETGQVFTPDAVHCIWHLSQGQPWLVNALAYELCFEMKQGRDRTRPIDKEMVDQAKENLIIRRETHLDQLADKLQEERVRRVVAGLLSGRVEVSGNLPEDDIQYVTDLVKAGSGLRYCSYWGVGSNLRPSVLMITRVMIRMQRQQADGVGLELTS